VHRRSRLDYNVAANPDVTIEIGTESFPARARVADGEQQSRLFEAQKRVWPTFAEHEQQTTRREDPT